MAPRTVLLTVANLLIPVAILVFATGFFPYKPFMPGLAEYEELAWSEKMGEDWQKPPEAPFDKLIFMVVDALRSDFAYGEESGMTFVQRYDGFSNPRSRGMVTDHCIALYGMAPRCRSQLTLRPQPSPCPASRP
jgi:hypothetical protein